MDFGKVLKLWKPMNAELGIMEIYQISAAFDEFWNLQMLRLKFKTNSVVSSLNTKAQNVTSKCAPNKDPRVTVLQFFTELRGKCQFFLRFGRKMSMNH